MAGELNAGLLAAQTALQAARKHAGTATLAALLLPLAAVPAAAVIAPQVTIEATSYDYLGRHFIDYTFTNNTENRLTRFELPEVNSGDLNFYFNFGSGIFSFRVADSRTPTSITDNGWSASEQMAADYDTSSLKVGTAGAYIELTGSGLFAGGSFTASAEVPITTTVDANFTAVAGDVTYQIDPPVPGVSDVPEPPSYALFGAGLLAVAGLRRRRRDDDG